MVLDKATGAIEHRHFYDIIDYLTPADCLVLNDSRVLPARIYGVKEGTGAHVEFLLPVSYTHLDVYKRQVKPQLRGAAAGSGRLLQREQHAPCRVLQAAHGEGPVPVSYTHLDVYKRQV